MSTTDFHDRLRAFVRESNRIEGITGSPAAKHVAAHVTLLALDKLTVDDVCRFVLSVAGRTLRNADGMNVRVGEHIPPRGGPHIEAALADVLTGANVGEHPYVVHQRYEHLHPFMDGNGRSGRAIWLWQMQRQGKDPYALGRGFLHTWYYQSLTWGRRLAPTPPVPLEGE